MYVRFFKYLDIELVSDETTERNEDTMSTKYEPEILGEWDDNGTMPANVAELAETVVGHRIVSVDKGVFPNPPRGWGSDTGIELTLDDGRKVRLRDTYDCCAFTEVERYVLDLANIDHVITGVGTTGGYTRWHIYADLGDVLELSVGWSRGNPFYYGYGFDITVEEAPNA